ncbi:hypothetical protein HGRIS_009066 [Hohenbuehelia grisea]|uniref:GST C-terminal domain-containing protein n=1 Tax=Hohenbuehelia grisea TaxID=104357 RepID=A0ABR3J038_9AGAR
MAVVDAKDLTKFKLEADGSVKRVKTMFRNTIEQGGKFEPEADRYVLYVSLACPWAHRTLIVRALKGLENIIAVVRTTPHMSTNGWPFASVDAFPGADVDPYNNADHVRDLYAKADPNHSGRPSVPVLWDTKHKTIVNNESAEIIRILNTAFNHLLPEKSANLDLFPPNLRDEIDEINAWIYDTINDGVYKSGFAAAQEVYEKAFERVFEGLDRVEAALKGKDYLIGDQLTEADVRLYVTIIRFDVVYHSCFKCNKTTIRDGYPEIHRWLRQLYWNNEAFKSTTNFDHIKHHYWWSLFMINANRIVPVGPIPSIHPLWCDELM